MEDFINICNRGVRKIKSIFIHKLKGTKLQFIIYRSYWHSILFKVKKQKSGKYFSSVPNPGAGIGHQLANWIAGYWYAKQFELKFAHIPFSSESWEYFLGFGEGEISVKELVKKKGYKKVRLPLFDETNLKDINIIKRIIKSYDKKVVFITEQDQFYKDQYSVIDDIKQKFYNAESRKDDKLIYNKNNFNIAVHIRRGDIVEGQTNNNPNLLMRWQDSEYFSNVLSNVIQNINEKRPIHIYIYSQGEESDFLEFNKFNNLHYCLDMSAQNSFLHMVYADLLITSKSSFSYKPALLSNGIKICPKGFWHGYPQTKGWILVEEDGFFDINILKQIIL